MDEVVDDLVIFNRGLAAFGPVSKAPLTTDAPCTPNMNLREIDKWAPSSLRAKSIGGACPCRPIGRREDGVAYS